MLKRNIGKILSITLLMMLLVGCETKLMVVEDKGIYRAEETKEGMTLIQEVEVKSKDGLINHYVEKASIIFENESDYKTFETSIKEMEASEESRDSEGIRFINKTEEKIKTIINIIEIDLEKANITESMQLIGVSFDENNKITLEKLEYKLLEQGLSKVDN